MRKSYILSYTPALASTHKVLTDILDALDPHCDWNAIIPNCLFFTSALTADEVAQRIEQKLGLAAGALYIVAEVNDNKQGRLSDRSWRLLNNPDNPRGA